VRLDSASCDDYSRDEMNPRTYLTNIVQGATGSKHTTASDSHPLVGSLAFSNCRGMLEF